METETDNKARHEFIATLDLEYKAKFVPFSQSRNKAGKHPSLNWIVTLSKGNQALQADYMQGCAHLPEYKHAESNLRWHAGYVARACQLGKYIPRVTYERANAHFGWIGGIKIPAPLLRDVLYSLSMDSDVLNAGTFEEWAGDFGYDLDSRNAEKIYRACLDNALKLRAMLGNDALDKLRELFQDY